MTETTGAELLEKLKALDLPANDFAIFGSGPMYPIGIKELGHDIDLIARGEAWQKATILNKPVQTQTWECLAVSLFDDQIEIFNGWGPGKWNIDELIDSADIFDGIRYVNLDNLIKWKKEMGRPKDLEHLKLIEEYLKNKS